MNVYGLLGNFVVQSSSLSEITFDSSPLTSFKSTMEDLNESSGTFMSTVAIAFRSSLKKTDLNFDS